MNTQKDFDDYVTWITQWIEGNRAYLLATREKNTQDRFNYEQWVNDQPIPYQSSSGGGITFNEDDLENQQVIGEYYEDSH